MSNPSPPRYRVSTARAWWEIPWRGILGGDRLLVPGGKNEADSDRGQSYMMLDVDWNWLPGEDHGNPAWKLDRVLYALVAPETHEVVYIGKSWGPVRRRWLAKDKEGLWKHLEQKLGMNKHGFVVGIVDPQKRYTLTTKLLQD